MPSRPILAAAVAYFAVAFGAGFVLGALREIVVVPRLGGLAAVALEAPIILVICRVAAGALVRRFAVPAGIAPRLAMGGIAFGLLQIAEIALAASFGARPADYVGDLLTAEGALGLAAQVVFAVLPVAVDRRG